MGDALTQWRREFAAGKRGDPSSHATWTYDPVWKAACADISAREIGAARQFAVDNGTRSQASQAVLTPPTVHRLEDLRANPLMLEPPRVIVPRFAWAGRATLFAAPDKRGKSTLVGQAVACKRQGQNFLDNPTPPGVVLWVVLDEPLVDVVRRLDFYGAEDGVLLVETMPTPGQISQIITEHGVDLLVVDTVTEWAIAGGVVSMNEAVAMGGLLKPYRDVLRRTDAAGLFLHHVRKSDGRSRDSSQLTASVDVVVEMTSPSEARHPTLRRCICRGRLPVEDFDLHFTEGRYHLDTTGGNVSVDLKVVRAVEANPGLGKRAIREAVDARAVDVDAAVHRLLAAGQIQDEGSPHRAALFAGSSGSAACPDQGATRTTVEDVAP